MIVHDPSGFGRLSRTRGPMRIVAILGLLLMLGGFAVFGFAILSTFQQARNGDVSGPPQEMIYGFGAAIVGAILYQLGLALGVPRKLEDKPYRPPKPSIYVSGSPGTTVNSKVSGGVHVQVTQVTLQWVDYLDQSLDDLEYLPKGARQAMAQVRDEVNAGMPQQAGTSLERLTNILVQGGALAGATTTVIQGIQGLAGMLGPYGAGALRLIGL